MTSYYRPREVKVKAIVPNFPPALRWLCQKGFGSLPEKSIDEQKNEGKKEVAETGESGV